MPRRRIVKNINEVAESILTHEIWELHCFFPELLKLKKEGIRRGEYLFIRCPFHKEQTPSFHWWIKKGAYHCYGCGQNGNLIDFFSKKKEITFFKAVLILAKFFKIPLHWERVEENQILPFIYYRPGQKAESEKLKRKNPFVGSSDAGTTNLPF